jgi:hypothetical protein
MPPPEKHFIDTSVMRPLISSSSAVKEYYTNEFSGNLYCCSYSKMEYIRGFIVPAINFYYLFKMPKILSINDALSLWSQKFQTRELKAVLSMFAGLLSNNNYDFNEYKDKEKASLRIADYILRILSIIPKKFKDVGIESNICPKINAKMELDIDKIDESFRAFLDAFNLKDKKDCNLHLFIERNSPKIQSIKSGRELHISDSDPKGFKEIVDTLTSNIGYSCQSCSKIGDLILAIISPNDMRLEHTDYSFDYLMMILNKKHKRHPSEISLNK